MTTAITLSDISNSYELSKNTTIKIGGLTLGGVKSGSVSFSFDEGADNSTRTDGGWKSSCPGRGNCSIDVTFNKLTSDDCQVGLRQWALRSDRMDKVAEIEIRTEQASTSAGTGFKGSFYLTSLNEDNADDPSQAIECQASFVSFGAVTADNYTASSSST